MMCPDFAALLAIGVLITAITMLGAAVSAYAVCHWHNDERDL